MCQTMGSFSYQTVLLVLLVTFWTIKFAAAAGHALNDSSIEESSLGSILSISEHHKTPPKNNLNIKPRASSDDEDKSGFIHSVWAIFLFSLIGILAFVGILIVLLQKVFPKKQPNLQEEGKPGTEQIFPTKTTFRDNPIQREVLPAHNPTFEEEAQIDEIYARPNENYRFRAENIPPTPNPPEKVIIPHYSTAPVNPKDTERNSPYYATDYNQDIPFKYLDKYNNPSSQGMEQPSAPPRAVLRDSTPYEVLEKKAHLSDENSLNEPGHQQDPFRFDSPSPPPMHSHLPSQQRIMHERGSSRFVRVFPREPPVTGALKPSPVFRRKF
ncbi:unnamed protein product [Orchesella dallaii]|uniref:Uncharacterized protein n=1 Tax=Orchesella dallaii TaxID=48710 RepID=A0ABP1RV80_9HEXA